MDYEEFKENIMQNKEEIDEVIQVQVINTYSKYCKKIDMNKVKLLGKGGEAQVKSIKPLAPIDIAFKINNSECPMSSLILENHYLRLL